MTDRFSVPERKSKASPNLFATWIVICSPVVAAATVLWVGLFIAKGKLPWSENPVFILSIAAILVGVFGSLGLAFNRRNWWWLIVTLISSVVAYVVFMSAIAIGMGRYN